MIVYLRVEWNFTSRSRCHFLSCKKTTYCSTPNYFEKLCAMTFKKHWMGAISVAL